MVIPSTLFQFPVLHWSFFELKFAQGRARTLSQMWPAMLQFLPLNKGKVVLDDGRGLFELWYYFQIIWS